MAQGGAGRDHHNEAFTLWMAGGGVRPGTVYGRTDELGYKAVDDRVHVHDFNATILHLLGVDHEKLTFKFQGRPYRLTDIAGDVVHDIIA
jgi:arylsulfatase A-like enzyme